MHTFLFKVEQDDLESEIASLEPYREAFFCLALGETPQVFTSGEYTCKVLGLSQALGGVIVTNEMCVMYADVWCQEIECLEHENPYARDLCCQVRKAQKHAVEARYGIERFHGKAREQ